MDKYAKNPLREILSKKEDTVVLIGNGINRYYHGDSFSWENLLKGVSSIVGFPYDGTFSGPTFIEVAELCDNNEIDISGIAANFAETCTLGFEKCELLDTILSNEIPILTTNYDQNIEKYLKLNLHSHRVKDWPTEKINGGLGWDCYYAKNSVSSPISGFGLWHIHGDMSFPGSILISASDYAKAMVAAQGYPNSQLPLCDLHNTSIPTENTWIKLFMEKKVCVIGLLMDKEEAFLRWLFIAKKKYQKEVYGNERNGWYIQKPTEEAKNEIDKKKLLDLEREKSRKLFFDSVGVEVVDVSSYQQIYDLT